MLRATTLADAIGVFDPREPLTGAALQEFYVNRPGNPLERMRIYLQGVRDQPVKLLFSGHRGCGKSTELNKLAEVLQRQFLVVPVQLTRFVNINTLTYQDVLLGMALALFRHAAEHEAVDRSPAQAVQEAWQAAVAFLRDKLYGPAFFGRALREAEATFKVSVLVTEVELKYGLTTNAREKLAAYIDSRFDELHQQMDAVAGLVRDGLNRGVLFVVEGTDKADLSRTRDIFLGHTNALTGFHNSAAIYTFPIELAYSGDFNQIQGAFDDRFALPNLNLAHRNGTPDPASRESLRQVVLRRLDQECIEPAAMELLVANSGGLVRSLVRLVRSAAVYALSRGETNRLGQADAEAAIADERRDFVRLLRSEHYPILAARHADKTLSADPAEQELLQCLALLEYSNADAWCDVHPAVLPEVRTRVPANPAA